MTTRVGKIDDLRNDFRMGVITPVDALEDVIAQIGRIDPVINCMAELDVDGAMRGALASTKRWQLGVPVSDLDGVPVTLKDSVGASGLTWRHGTAPNANRAKATADSPPASRLRDAGAVIVGKTTMPDFGMLAAGVSSLYGVTRNPWNVERNTGGSSSGAGAALAAGIGFGAVGTDIAGSVRLPGAHCGLVALKPTHGRVPHTPVSNMRSAGPMGRYVRDVAGLFNVLAQPDIRDMACLPATEPYTSTARQNLKGLRVGVLEEMGYGPDVEAPVQNAVDAAAAVLQGGGADIQRIPAPFDSNPYPALDRVFQVRAWAELQSTPESKRHEVEEHVIAWAAAARDFDAARYHNDLAAVSSSAAHLVDKLSQVDLVLSPVLPIVGFSAESVGIDPGQPLAHCSFTCWFNQTGQPAITLCFGMEGGMPIGVQLVAPRFGDNLVLDVAGWLEERREFRMNWPLQD